MSDKKQLEKILDKEIILDFSDIIFVVDNCIKNKMAQEEIVEYFKNADLIKKSKGILTLDLLNHVIRYRIDKTSQDSEIIYTIPITIYEKEMEFLDNVENTTVRKMLYMFLLQRCYKSHCSGWIRYDRQWLLSKAGLLNKTASFQRGILAQVIQDGKISFRIIGQKSPIPCFKLGYGIEELVENCAGEKSYCLHNLNESLLFYRQRYNQ